MRSYYLDDMDVQPGDQVRCKDNISADWIKIGAVYTVIAFAMLRAKDGTVYEYPSARFQHVEN